MTKLNKVYTIEVNYWGKAEADDVLINKQS